ncbi:GNAT family N-acetyltransferase [Sphingopyxis sp. MWB1]|uniref:GNAT family N-acetyltransferase n=1 Tax=Sphingopyxis sp. MWB1 TaxID=1537715 RepID=UPI000519FE58|nr:GNAT family protein [Sphingopyxis sp. MWB1]
MPVPTLTTQRLVLRQIRADDAPVLFPVLSDPQVMIWWSSAPQETLAETQSYVAKNAAEDQGYGCWAITLSGDDTALGWVVLYNGKPGVKEIGYILHRDHWGGGVAREAVSRVIDHGFDDLGLRRIFADTDPENHGSIAMLQRLGFQREGYLRAEWETHMGVRDTLIFGLLRDEWNAARASMNVAAVGENA